MKIHNILNCLALFICFGFTEHIQALELQDFVLPGNKPATISEIIPLSDGETYLAMSIQNDKIQKISYKTGEVLETVFDSSTARNCTVKNWNGFTISEDESKILLHTDNIPIYRNTFKADYYVFEIKRNNLTPLSQGGKQEIATFSPDGRMVAFVRDNNIYIKKLDYGTEVAVTTDGMKNKIINGVPDWVYQEEFRLHSSLSFSPDNLILSYLQWDETNVPEYSLPIYESACDPIQEYSLYPGEFKYKYPVAGANNAKVKLLSYDVETRKTKEIAIPMDEDGYIPNIKFSKQNDRLMVMTLNRNQNLFKLFAVNPRSTTSKLVYSEESKTWIDIENITSMIKYYDNTFVIPSDRSGWTHLYEYSNAGNLLRQLTSGDWEVTDFYGYDNIGKSFYFQSTESGVLNRVVSKIDDKGKKSHISNADSGTSSVSFNSKYTYFVLNYSDITTPNQYTIWNNKGKKVREMEMNDVYAAKFATKGMPVQEFFQCPSGSLTLNGYIIKPADFNPSKKYPVIMTQYSGPGSQEVRNRWMMDWTKYAATQGYIIACVDGRGTGFRGKEWESSVYMSLGKYETIDQLAAAKYIASLPYVDGAKIGIFGWSYGGYESLMAMSQVDSKYAAGVAIAPVTDWRYYDSIYTERYMRTPKENQEGYEISAPIKKVDKLSGELLIISGTADDNVHIANTLEYTAALTSCNKICDMMVYTNMNHSINGCGTRYPLFKRVMKFFDSHLK